MGGTGNTHPDPGGAAIEARYSVVRFACSSSSDSLVNRLGGWKPASGASTDPGRRRSQRDGQAGHGPTRQEPREGTLPPAGEHVKSN